VLRRS